MENEAEGYPEIISEALERAKRSYKRDQEHILSRLEDVKLWERIKNAFPEQAMCARFDIVFCKLLFIIEIKHIDDAKPILAYLAKEHSMIFELKEMDGFSLQWHFKNNITLRAELHEKSTCKWVQTGVNTYPKYELVCE